MTKISKENAEFNSLLHKCICAVDDSQAVYDFQHIMFFDNMPKAKVNRLLEFIDRAALDSDQDCILCVITKEEYQVEMTALRGMYRGILSYGKQQGWHLTKGYQYR